MLGYYLSLAIRSFKRNKALTALMVLAIALGIGASMTTLTVFHTLSGDPIPQKSGTLFYPMLDAASKKGLVPGEEPEWQLTRFDAEALLREKRGDRQALMTAGNVAINPDKAGIDPFYASSRFTSADFFPMFEVPMAQGRGWTTADDDTHARVAVISQKLNEKLFGDSNSIGKKIRLGQSAFTVVGVLAKWRLIPRFYDVTNDKYTEVEQIFIPFSTAMDLKLNPSGNMNCWGDIKDDGKNEGPRGVNAPCAWLQYWVELDSPEKEKSYRQYLVNYSDQQRAAGRFERPSNVRLYDVMEWLDRNEAVPSDVRLQRWLAFGFLFVCLINTVGLLLAKFMRRSSEIGVRRALGATRRAIFSQYLIEAGVVGFAGGILGIGLAQLGVWAVRQQPTSYEKLAHFDTTMLFAALGLTILVSAIAGLLPAWRACQVAPAIQLKSQ
jgi:putative ABC transport system permease protein